MMKQYAMILVGYLLLSVSCVAADDFTTWQPVPADWKPAEVAGRTATLQRRGNWAYLVAPAETAHAEVAATVTIDSPATQFGFFGSSWSVWPDPTVADQGFEAAVLVRGGADGTSGYRVQLSSKYQQVTLVRFPDGGYVRSVPCQLKTQKPIRLRVKAAGNVIRVFVDDNELIQYVDRLSPALQRGRIAVGASSSARVTFTDLAITPVEAEASTAPQPHRVRLAVRQWLGGRPWVFDGDEPILLLPSTRSTPVMNVKLLPGFKPLLTWNSHWDTQNQGAYKEATNKTVDVQTSGGGESLIATWRGKHTQDRFGTTSTMTVGFDSQRGTYTYDIDSELEVYAGEPFHFRYGFDFEHHTPIDPFNWQYLVVRRRGGDLYHRPVSPVDPGPQYDLETYHGLRVWYGRHNGDLRVAPAVEYKIHPEWNKVAQPDGTSKNRMCNTAVCAAFYDTGVSFTPETSKPGTKIRVKYRYTGYPADEARRLFEQSTVYNSPTLDSNHHYIFADEWPKLTFSQFVPMSQPWLWGRSPFMTGHNQRPTYELVKDCGAGSGFAMKLGPASFGKARLSKAGSLAKGRYVLTALVKSDNVLGPGGRIELEATQGKTKQVLTSATHFVGNGSFDWQRQGFAFDLSESADTLNIAFGNAGTGDFLVTDVEIGRLNDGESLPAGVLAKASGQPAPLPPAPSGAIADYRMLEGRGYHAFNYAGGTHLDLANLDWVVDAGRPALRFAENETGRRDYHPAGYIGMHIFGNAQDFNYLASYRAYKNRQTVPFAMGARGSIVLGCERYYLHGAFYRGLIGRTLILRRALNADELKLLAQDQPLPAVDVSDDSKGVTLAAWIKPAAELGQNNQHPRGGDIIGFGNRRYVLKLLGTGDRGQSAPYRLAARLNVNDGLATEPILEAGQWSHVAVTTTPENGQQRMRLFIDARQVAEDVTKKWSN